MKEGDSPCGFCIPGTAFYAYVRDQYFCVGASKKEGRKEARNQAKILVDCDTDSCGYG